MRPSPTRDMISCRRFSRLAASIMSETFLPFFKTVPSPSADPLSLWNCAATRIASARCRPKRIFGSEARSTPTSEIASKCVARCSRLTHTTRMLGRAIQWVGRTVVAT